MSYHVLAYGSETLPAIDREEHTVALMDLWKYPFVVVMNCKEWTGYMDALAPFVIFDESARLH